MLSDRIRAMGAPHWLALFGLILAAWGALYLMAVPQSLRDMGDLYGAEFWAGLCVVTPDAAGFARMVLMWALMSAAMMAPTVLPALATYDDLSRSGAATSMPRLVAQAISPSGWASPCWRRARRWGSSPPGFWTRWARAPRPGSRPCCWPGRAPTSSPPSRRTAWLNAARR